MAMPRSATSVHSRPAPLPGGETVTVETRFGTYHFAAEDTVVMPQGLLGFAERRRFGLAELPESIGRRFKLLQSFEEPTLCFIVAALPESAGLIDEADLQEACEVTGIARARATFLLIVTIRPNEAGDGIGMSVNLRAPIVLDSEQRIARQHVLSNGDYPVRQDLRAV